MTKKTKYAEKELTPNQVVAWQLRKAGHNCYQIAKILDVSYSTVRNWTKKVDDAIAELPEVKAATDFMQTLIPKALRTYRKMLDFSDKDHTALTAAKDILTHFKVIKPNEQGATRNTTVNIYQELVAPQIKEHKANINNRFVNVVDDDE